MADGFYAKEKLEWAVWTLATHPGSVRERLFGAYLEIHLIQDAIPSEYREEHRRILRDMNNPDQTDEGEGTVKATLAAMDEEQAVDIAKRIHELNSKIVDL
ncbi:MAG: hypothetical protein F4Y49_03630 [Dehalococcoidia bacterium]|nr:hypothetical protein [Dehalococcoidia bacterium]